jgi:predicted nucleic-acid-binding protein
VIGLDTNVLVRFVVADDAAQAERARSFVAGADARGEDLFVPDVVLCELVWVLERAYDFPKREIAEVLGRLLAARRLSFRDRTLARRALDRYARGRGDFADYLVHQQAVEAGCEVVCTFDRELLKEPGFGAP